MKAILKFLRRKFLYFILFRGNNALYYRYLGAQVGNNCRIHQTHMGSEPWLIKIGDNTTISDDVRLITHDGSTRLFRNKYPQLNSRFGNTFGPIVIGKNCFIGVGVIILPGVTIGDDCIIGAGSVVTRDIPPRSVAIGNPAKVHKSLDDYIEEHLKTFLPLQASSVRELRGELINMFADRLKY